jgi:uncharacterized membrane protein
LPIVVAAVVYGPIIGFVTTQLVSLYLLVASLFNVNVNELFAGQGIEDAKSFLRMHIAADGTLMGVLRRSGRRLLLSSTGTAVHTGGPCGAVAGHHGRPPRTR